MFLKCTNLFTYLHKWSTYKHLNKICLLIFYHNCHKILIFWLWTMFSITLEILYPERSGGGTVPPVHPLEPDAGSNILILHIYSGFLFLINWHLAMSQFVHFMIISEILSCTLILFTIFYFPGFHLKFEAVLLKLLIIFCQF